MADSANLASLQNLGDTFRTLQNLGDTIRAIERGSGQPSQLVIKVGDEDYLIGDLTTRKGKYRLEMSEQYKPRGQERSVKNPYLKLARTYPSFDDLREAVESASPKTGKTSDSRNRPCINGSHYNGYSVAVLGTNFGMGQTYLPIGKIIFPLLQDGEKVDIKIIP